MLVQVAGVLLLDVAECVCLPVNSCDTTNVVCGKLRRLHHVATKTADVVVVCLTQPVGECIELVQGVRRVACSEFQLDAAEASAS